MKISESKNQPEINFDLSLARTLALLKDMNYSHLLALLAHAKKQFFYAGQTIFSAGSSDHAHLYLLYGDVGFCHDDGTEETIKGNETTTPLMHGQPRQYTLIAKTDCAILSVNSDWLDKLLTWSQVADYLRTVISRERDLDEDVDWMMTILKSNLFFKVPPVNVEKIFSEVKTRLVSQGDVILREGDIGQECYFIKDGEAVVTQSSTDGLKVLASIERGRCFGEDALVNNAPRSATVTMTTDGVLMLIEKANFFQLLKEPEVSSLSLESLDEIATDIAPVMVDVRSDEEYSLSHYPGAVNIPLHLLAIKSRQLLLTVEYLLYCDTGRRSKAATYLLAEQGFKVKFLENPVDLFNYQKERGRLVTEDNYVLRGGLPVKGS